MLMRLMLRMDSDLDFGSTKDLKKLGGVALRNTAKQAFHSRLHTSLFVAFCCRMVHIQKSPCLTALRGRAAAPCRFNVQRFWSHLTGEAASKKLPVGRICKVKMGGCGNLIFDLWTDPRSSFQLVQAPLVLTVLLASFGLGCAILLAVKFPYPIP